MLNGKDVVCMAYLPIVLPARRKYDDYFNGLRSGSCSEREAREGIEISLYTIYETVLHNTFGVMVIYLLCPIS